MRYSILSAILGLAVGNGAAASERFFPIGIYDVHEPADLRIIREAGFNAAQIPGDPAKLDNFAAAARKTEVRLMIPAGELMASAASTRGVPIAAWYLADEPDVNHMKPGALLELDRKVHAWSSNIPTAFVVGDGRAVSNFAASGNIVMVDWYPVPHLPLSSAGDQVRQAVKGASGKPVWAVLQAMDWKDYPQKDPRKPKVGRFPNISEIRFMSYDAVLQGANGLWYYTFTRPDGLNLTQVPELWFALTWVVRELAQMRPIFENGVLADVPFTLDSENTQVKLWRWHGRRYAVILNRSGNVPAPVPAELLDGNWRPLFEDRRDPHELLDEKDGVFRLKPYQVLVLEGPA